MSRLDDDNKKGFHEAVFVSSKNDKKRNEEIKEKIIKELTAMGYVFDIDGNIFSPKNVVSDGILGFVVGDALGVPVEFASRKILKSYPVIDMQGNGRYDVPKGTWSDDTSMVLATIDSISTCNEINYYDIMHKFTEWMMNAKYTATDIVFDIGITTRNALLKYANGEEPLRCGSMDFNNNGNGSLMRMLPIAYYLSVANLDDLHEVEIVNKVSSLTHSHEISCLGCKIYCDYVKQLINGVDKKEALKNLKKKDYSKYYLSSAIQVYERILASDLTKLKIDDINSSGYVVDTLEASLWCTLNSNSFEEALLKAVNLGLDTDTIGAITGSLNGIIYTKNGIPSNWLNEIKKRGYIDGLISKFTACLNNINNDVERSNSIK